MAATGDYLLFADSDDMLPEDTVEKLAGKADSSHADLIDGGYREWCEGKAGRLQKPFDVSDEKLLKLLVCQNIITNLGCGAESISVRSSWSTGYSLKRASTMRKIFSGMPSSCSTAKGEHR